MRRAPLATLLFLFALLAVGIPSRAGAAPAPVAVIDMEGAITPVTVLRIPRDALEENLAADPGLSLRFYRTLGMLLSHRLRTTLDPEKVCQDAIDAGLVVHRAHPLTPKRPCRR